MHANRRYILKAFSVVTTLIIIKFAFFLLDSPTFEKLTLALSLSALVSFAMGLGGDWEAQREAAKGNETSLQRMIIFHIIGFFPGAVLAWAIGSMDLQLTLLIVILAVPRSINSFLLAANIQRTPTSFRVEFGLTFFEPMLWLCMTAGLSLVDQTTKELSAIYTTMSVALLVSYVLFRQYPWVPTWRTHNQKQLQLPNRKHWAVVAAKLTNSVAYQAPAIILLYNGAPTEAALFAIAQKYANIILLFEQVRSRTFTAKMLQFTDTTSTKFISATVQSHIRATLLTGAMMTVALAILVSAQARFGVAGEIDNYLLLIAVFLNVCTILEFGFGGYSILRGHISTYLTFNLAFLALSCLAGIFLDSITQTLVILILFRALYTFGIVFNFFSIYKKPYNGYR